MKREIKRILLKIKNIDIDRKTDINFDVESCKTGKKNVIVDSHIRLEKIGYGCFLEHVYGFGRIRIGNYVSISGPGTILHAEVGNISIGSYTSIAANVSIQEFNHNIERITTSAVHYRIFEKENMLEDVISKGDITIEEDVWIGSNAIILSGVSIGRGAVVGAGCIVTKNVPEYAVVAGNPMRILKYRFDKEKIEFLNRLKWWEWPEEKIKEHNCLFHSNINKKQISEIERMLR